MKRERGTGHIYQRGNRWWIEYWGPAGRKRESAGKTEPEAKKKLKQRFKEIAAGRYVGPDEEQLTVGELCDNLILHLTTKGAKAVPSFESHLKPIREAFEYAQALSMTTERIEHFIAERRAAGKADTTVNRETGALRQALNLARKQGRLSRVPYIPMLREDNARQGFFERADFEAIAAKLVEQEQVAAKTRRPMGPLSDVARFDYLTGWRKEEALALRWELVDRQGKEIRLATSKNGRGRALALDGELLDLIERRWKAREYQTAAGQTGISEYVFHRQGRRMVDFRKAWATACRAAGVVKPCDRCDGVPAAGDATAKCRRCEGSGTRPKHLFHDFRRTAARDMVRAGTPETVAMSITGHKTRSMFDRYCITSGDDQRAAQRQTAEYRAKQPASRDNVVPLRQESA